MGAQVNSVGIIATVAGNGSWAYGGVGDGGPATAASLYDPYGVVVSPNGDIYLSDSSGNRVRKVSSPC